MQKMSNLSDLVLTKGEKVEMENKLLSFISAVHRPVADSTINLNLKSMKSDLETL